MNNLKFRFNFVSLEQTLDEINKLNPKRAYQTTLSEKSISDCRHTSPYHQKKQR